MKAYKCVRCKKTILQQRVYAAKSRGHEPKFCSDPCRYAAGSKSYRDRNKPGQTPAKVAAAKKAVPAEAPGVVDILAELDALTEGGE